MPLKMAMCFLYQYLFSYGTFVIQENPALRQHKDPRSLGSLPVCVWTFPEVTILFQETFFWWEFSNLFFQGIEVALWKLSGNAGGANKFQIPLIPLHPPQYPINFFLGNSDLLQPICPHIYPLCDSLWIPKVFTNPRLFMLSIITHN